MHPIALYLVASDVERTDGTNAELRPRRQLRLVDPHLPRAVHRGSLALVLLVLVIAGCSGVGSPSSARGLTGAAPIASTRAASALITQLHIATHGLQADTRFFRECSIRPAPASSGKTANTTTTARSISTSFTFSVSIRKSFSPN